MKSHRRCIKATIATATIAAIKHMKSRRCIKATIATATIAAIKHMYELHDKSEFKLVMVTRLNMRFGRNKKLLDKLWAEHDLLGRAIVRAEATLPQRIVDRVKSGEL